MEDSGTASQELFVKDDTSGEYVAYEPPEPPAFKETLPEDIRESEHLSEVEDGHQLARYYVNLKKDYLAPPDAPDGYEFEKPEDFIVEDDRLNALKQVAHEEGMNQKQFARLMQHQANNQKQDREAIEKAITDRRAEAEQSLKTEWGDQYESKLESAKKVLNHEKLGGEEFKKFLNDTRFGDHPQVAKFFANLSELISEDAFVKPGTGDAAPEKPRSETGQPMFSFPSMDK